MDLLLSEKNYRKLRLLKYFTIYPQNNNIKDISIFLNLSNTSTKRLLLDLNNDLITYFHKKIYINVTSISVSLINDDKYYTSIDLIETLSMSYLKESLSFQILNLLFRDNDTSVNQIIDNLFISRSFFYRTINGLIDPINSWHIKFNLPSKPNSLNFIAKQIHLRAFYVYFFWSSFKHLEWPFDPQEHILISNYLSRSELSYFSHSKLRRIEIYLSITNKMIKENHFIELNNDEKQLLKCVADEYDLSAPLEALFINQHLNYSFTNIENEKLFFNFVLRFLSPGIDSSSQIKNIGNNFFQSKTQTTLFSKKFLNFILNKFHLDTTKDTFNEIFYYVVFYFFIFEKLNIDYLSFIKIAPHINRYSIDSLENKDLSHSIKDAVNLFFKKNSSFHASTNNNPIDVFYNLVYFIVSSLQKKKLLVYVQCNKNMYSESFIIKKLISIFSTETLIITSFIEEADLIITDSKEYFSKNKQEVYYFEFTHDLDTWWQLTSFLQNKILTLALM